MVDVSPFTRVSRKGKEVLVIRPAIITGPIDKLMTTYEIHDGLKLVTCRGGWKEFGGGSTSRDIRSINIDIEKSSIGTNLKKLGARNLLIIERGRTVETWQNVPNAEKVKNLIENLKSYGPEYLNTGSKNSASTALTTSQSQNLVPQGGNTSLEGELLPANQQSNLPANNTYNDHRDVSTHDNRDYSTHIKNYTKIDIHNNGVAMKVDEDGNPLAMPERYDPERGANILMGKEDSDSNDKAKSSLDTLKNFRKIASLPAGFANMVGTDNKDRNDGQPITEMSIDAHGRLLTNIAGGELKRSWNIATGRFTEDAPNASHPLRHATTTFYDGRHKTVCIQSGKIILPFDNDFSLLTNGGWDAVKNKHLTVVVGAFPPNRTRLIAAADEQGCIHITHTTLSQHFNILIKHGGGVTYLNWSGKKSYGASEQLPGQTWATSQLTSASVDGTIRVWEAERGAELGRFWGINVERPAIAENETHFAYADQEGFVQVYERL
jgi:hypothetical protein